MAAEMTHRRAELSEPHWWQMQEACRKILLREKMRRTKVIRPPQMACMGHSHWHGKTRWPWSCCILVYICLCLWPKSVFFILTLNLCCFLLKMKQEPFRALICSCNLNLFSILKWLQIFLSQMLYVHTLSCDSLQIFVPVLWSNWVSFKGECVLSVRHLYWHWQAVW